MSVRKLVTLWLVAMMIATAGCGGGTDSATEASASFLGPNTKSTIPKFGREADASEREAASKVLEENLTARETGDWKTQCSTLSTAAVKKVEEEWPLFAVKANCVRSLSVGSEPLPSTAAIRVNTLVGTIDAFRIKGNRGYALYHGAKGKDYAMPMRKEDGEWKVDGIATRELN